MLTGVSIALMSLLLLPLRAPLLLEVQWQQGVGRPLNPPEKAPYQAKSKVTTVGDDVSDRVRARCKQRRIPHERWTDALAHRTAAMRADVMTTPRKAA